MSTTAERMGVAGGGTYGRRVDDAMLIIRTTMEISRDEQLALAWALVDQASSLRTTRLAKAAMDAIEDLYDAEEVPPTCPTGVAP